jgi:hypothetical protein
LELANAERKAQLKVEEEERKLVGQSQKFLVSVCKLFNSYSAMHKAVTFERVEVILRKGREDLDARQSLRRAKNLVGEVKQL